MDAGYDVWRTHLKAGYVGAEPFLIEGTIYENLVYGSKQPIEREDCWKALKEAGLEEEIYRLPEQLDTPMSENGSGLSSGQKQRLALARAILGKPDLLFLDEVSSNLDTETERLIARSISRLRGRCTVLVISHRPGILEHADRCLDLTSRQIKTVKPGKNVA